MKLRAIVTSLTLVVVTSSAFAKSFGTDGNHFQTHLASTAELNDLPNGVVTIEELGRPVISDEVKNTLFNRGNGCADSTVESVTRSSGTESGVTFNDGLSGGTITTGVPELDVILNMGKQAWQLIQENAPVVNTQLTTANALPAGIRCWNQLEKWQAIRSIDYQITFKSWLKTDAIRYTARVIYAYGGSYKGRGRYIANATVQNAELMVKSTNILNVAVQVPMVLNSGDSANPNATMQINIVIEAKNKFLPIVHHQRTVSFVLYGDGRPAKVIRPQTLP